MHDECDDSAWPVCSARAAPDRGGHCLSRSHQPRLLHRARWPHAQRQVTPKGVRIGPKAGADSFSAGIPTALRSPVPSLSRALHVAFVTHHCKEARDRAGGL